MNPAATPHVSSAPVKSRRRRLVTFLAIAAFMVLGPFAIKCYFDWRLRADWADAEAEADRLDPGWRLRDILAKLEPIPDEENSALLIHELAQGKWHERFDPYAKGFSWYPPTARLGEEQVKSIEPQWTKLRDSIEKARKLKDMPRGRMLMENADDWEILNSRALHAPNLIGGWLHWDAYLLTQNGELHKAAENCIAILNAGRSLKDEQGQMAMLWRLVSHHLAVTLERVLAQGKLSDVTLGKLQAALDEEARENIFLQGIRGERNYRHLYFENICDGKLTVDNLHSASPGLRGWWHKQFPGTLLQYYPESLRQMNEFVEIAKLPIHARGAKVAAFQTAISNSGNPLMTRYIASQHDPTLESACMLRTALVAVACERYRLALKAWPPSLEVLVREKYLTEIPLDPWDGAPLRFHAIPDGVVIYSVGKNKIDEQGNMRRHGFMGASDDQAFRLWDEQFRGQPPVPIVERKKKKK